MFMLKLSRIKNEQGLSLAELIVTVAVLGILSAIAIPIVFSQTDNAKAAVASSDARGVGLAISGEVSGYYSFGSTDGSIFDGGDGYLHFSPMTNADPVATGPGTDRILLALSEGSSISGTYGSGIELPWCITVTNDESVAVFTNAGMQQDATGCLAGGVAN
jgi:prepilin-type N-terminal cleavage/methylation domain-containing protein